MLKIPSKQTLKKYGLSLEEWEEMANKQNRVCYICLKLPKSERLCVDHVHVKLWKKKPPEQRKLYVRGLLCSYCNLRLVSKGITLQKAQNIVKYLLEYEEKKVANGVK
jgi:hypothetical protein